MTHVAPTVPNLRHRPEIAHGYTIPGYKRIATREASPSAAISGVPLLVAAVGRPVARRNNLPLMPLSRPEDLAPHHTIFNLLQ